MTAQEIIERIMTAHWDMITCPCWVCKAGNLLGFRCREHFLPHREDNRKQHPVPASGWWAEAAEAKGEQVAATDLNEIATNRTEIERLSREGVKGYLLNE